MRFYRKRTRVVDCYSNKCKNKIHLSIQVFIDEVLSCRFKHYRKSNIILISLFKSKRLTKISIIIAIKLNKSTKRNGNSLVNLR